MLWFLSIAAKRGLVVDSYRDDAVGIMGRNSGGKTVVATVRLRPLVSFNGAKRPTSEELTAIHHAAHDACFIANSITTEVQCEPVLS